MGAPQLEGGLDANLREIGCPYPAEDYRTPLWLEGYTAGFKAGGDTAHGTFVDVLDRAGK